MSRSYPIWVDIDSCIYNSDKSYGIRKHGVQDIKIGTSKKNSHNFARIILTHEILNETDRLYQLRIDNEIIKSTILSKDGKLKITTGELNET